MNRERSCSIWGIGTVVLWTVTAFFTIASYALSGEPPVVYVSLDSSPESDMLHVWFDKPWAETINPEIDLSPQQRSKLHALESVRARLMPGLIVADWSDWEVRKAHRIPEASQPIYRVGRYGEWQSFPPGAFRYPELSLMWLDYVRSTWDITEQVEKWERQCKEARWATLNAYEFRYNCYCYEWWDWERVSVNVAKNYPHLPPLPVIAFRPHPNQLHQNPLEDWK